MQPDFAVRVGDAFAGQHVVEPGQAVGATVAVVGVAKAEQRAPVARENRVGPAPQRTHRQQQEAGRVGERVRHRGQAPMAHLAEADAGTQRHRG